MLSNDYLLGALFTFLSCFMLQRQEETPIMMSEDALQSVAAMFYKHLWKKGMMAVFTEWSYDVIWSFLVN